MKYDDGPLKQGGEGLLMERRKGERFVLPELYSKYNTFKIRKISGDFLDANLSISVPEVSVLKAGKGY